MIIKSTPRTYIPSIITDTFLLRHTWNLNVPLFNLLKAQFFYSLPTNLLYWAHWACNPILLGLGYKLWPYTHHFRFYIHVFIWQITHAAVEFWIHDLPDLLLRLTRVESATWFRVHLACPIPKYVQLSCFDWVHLNKRAKKRVT